MGADSKIEWTHHTFNPWWGCVKVSPACKHCYAEGFAKRTGHKVWGPDAPRRFFGPKHHAEPYKWNRLAQLEGVRKRVFCASMSDVFESVDGDIGAQMDSERSRLWLTIEETPYLDWLLLTKRPQNVLVMIPERWRGRLPANVWVGTTAENQECLDERLPDLLRIPAAVRFLSCEPLLGPLDLRLDAGYETGGPQGWIDSPRVDWVIVGGESGGGARAMQTEWARDLRDQCTSAGVPFHFKQWGEHNEQLVRIGKKKAGRDLDGRTWDGFPVSIT